MNNKVKTLLNYTMLVFIMLLAQYILAANGLIEPVGLDAYILHDKPVNRFS